MRRRMVLATIGISLSTPLVGCLQGTDTPESSTEEREYEECYLTEIQYEWLPQDVKDEVDAGLEEGTYEADRLLFARAVDVEESYLVVDDTPYDPEVETRTDTQILELNEVEVIRALEPRVITVRNTDDRNHEIHVELTNDEPFVDRTVALEPDEEVELDATDRFGTYALSARVRTGHGGEEDDYRYAITDSTGNASITVTADSVRITHAVSDLEPCPWDATGSPFPS